MRCLPLCALAACTTNAPTAWEPPDPPPPQREHDPRFHGWWAVEQPFHALYEVTFYDFRPDGELVLGPSEPSDCSGHLARHCVTGSVARCVGAGCESELTCVFGQQWWSEGASRLVIVGECSDQRAREIVIAVDEDASSNTSFGGAGGTLLSVGGELGWSHDNWDWSFRKCAPGTDPASCSALD